MKFLEIAQWKYDDLSGQGCPVSIIKAIDKASIDILAGHRSFKDAEDYANAFIDNKGPLYFFLPNGTEVDYTAVLDAILWQKERFGCFVNGSPPKNVCAIV